LGIFSSIKSAIFGSDEKEVESAPAATAAPAADELSQEEVERRIASIPGADDLNWKTSIIDLMKLVRLDPTYANRKELAVEMGNTDYSGTAEDNIALHKAMMDKIAEAGGIVPDDLKD